MARDTGLHLPLVGSKGMNREGLVTGSSLTPPAHTPFPGAAAHAAPPAGRVSRSAPTRHQAHTAVRSLPFLSRTLVTS